MPPHPSSRLLVTQKPQPPTPLNSAGPPDSWRESCRQTFTCPPLLFGHSAWVFLNEKPARDCSVGEASCSPGCRHRGDSRTDRRTAAPTNARGRMQPVSPGDTSEMCRSAAGTEEAVTLHRGQMRTLLSILALLCL